MDGESMGCSSIFGFGIIIIFWIAVVQVIAEAFDFDPYSLLAVIIVALVVSFLVRRIVAMTSQVVFAITTFIMWLSVSLLTAVPVVAFFVFLFTRSNYREIRGQTYTLLVLDAIIILIITFFELRSRKESIENSKKTFEQNTKGKISRLLQNEATKKIPNIWVLSSYIEIFSELYQSEINETKTAWYTNEEFVEKSIELFELLETIKYEKIKDIKLINSVFGGNSYLGNNVEGIFDRYNYDSPISQCYGICKGQSGEDKVKKIMDSLGILYYDSFNLQDKISEESVEIDFITILNGIIYVIEVKDYSADKIIMESSGQLFKEVNNQVYKLDTLKQIARHNQFLRKVNGPSINIFNFIVLTDEDTIVQNNFKNDNMKVIYVDAIEFELRGQQSQEDKDILLRLKENTTEAKRFKFFDIDSVLSRIYQLMEEEKKASKQLDELLSDHAMSNFNGEIKEFILEQLKQVEGYHKNKGQSAKIVEDLSSSTTANYKWLLSEMKTI